LKWKPITNHFKITYIKVKSVPNFDIFISNGKYALLNDIGEWAVAPDYIVNTLRNFLYERERGPFIFKNGFEETQQAQYLVSMMRYPELTVAAARKVDSIRTQYSDWIDVDKEVIKILRRYIKWL
jgi:hypothetical protein